MSHCGGQEEDRPGSPGSSCLSMKSDRSKELNPPAFSPEPGPPNSGDRTRTQVSEEQRLSSCALCQAVLKDPVSTSCGHWFCRQCITSYRDQSDSAGDCPCPQYGERPRTMDSGLQDVKKNRQTSNVCLSKIDPSEWF
ncbi:tripartite motif-containing protein 72-like [Mastacembelus armatus]|uniref:tripartite motif-containing protein 72-like n=1 Tax=Mastacembelus armatus TaxID=205130 RepID=UPI000E45DBF2|nr:tripartite motif-containing protein 72-like [Mastacembelus armatus]